MNESTMFQSGLQSGINSRSMGVKLIVICVLALLMTIPSFFVGGLVEERSQGVENVVQQTSAHAGQQSADSSAIRMVDSYRSVTRSLKICSSLPWTGLPGLTSYSRLRPASEFTRSDVLVGTAQIIFYSCFSLSLSEKAGFDLAFLLAGGSTVASLSTNAGWVFFQPIAGDQGTGHLYPPLRSHLHAVAAPGQRIADRLRCQFPGSCGHYVLHPQDRLV